LAAVVLVVEVEAEVSMAVPTQVRRGPVQARRWRLPESPVAPAVQASLSRSA